MATDREDPQSIQDMYGQNAFYGPDGKIYIVTNPYSQNQSLPQGTMGNWGGYADYLNSQIQPMSNFDVPDYAMQGGSGVIPLDAINSGVTQYGINYQPADPLSTKLALAGITGLAGAGLMGALPGTTSIFGEGGLGGLFGGDNVLSGIDPTSWMSGTDTFGAANPTSLMSGAEGLDFSGIGPYEGEAPFSYGDTQAPAPVTDHSVQASNGTSLGGIWDWVKQNPGLVGALGSLVGGGLQAYGANRAANTQANAALQAIAAQQGIYNQQRADLAPWMQTGQMANTTLGGLTGLKAGGGFDPNAMLVKPFGMSDLQADPFFQPEFTKLSQDVLNRHSALGGVNSGATLKDLNDYALTTGYQNAYNRYNNNLQNVWNRLYSLSGSGQNAAATVGGFGGQLGAGMANNLTGAGNAQAAGQVGVSNAIGGGLAGAYNALLTDQILNQTLKV